MLRTKENACLAELMLSVRRHRGHLQETATLNAATNI